MTDRLDFGSGREPGGLAAVSRRGVVQTGLAATVGSLLPSAVDLNDARTMAQTPRPNPSMTVSPFANAPMTYEGVVAQAKALAAQPYKARSDALPPELAGLSYDDYQAIQFRPEKTIPLGRAFSMQPFHRGFIQRKRVDIVLQPPDGPAKPLVYDPALFDLGPALQGRTYPASLGYAGFRLNYAFDAERPDTQEEFLVFLGASYFRLRGKNQVYGLSARGVAINTFGPGTEEFPDFTALWILEPSDEPNGAAKRLTMLALLDGPSLSGAYRFEVEPGETARIAVTASLHFRRDVARLGLAPLTSMFLHGENGSGASAAQPAFDDFRPQVHDSDGLLVATAGDRLWRPLVNGRTDRISAFRVAPLDGFGLMQRERVFAAYLDVQARHEDRPGLWVKPDRAAGVFASGAVQLFEIPSREEATDNMVAAFVPDAKPASGSAMDFGYSLTTIGAEPAPLLSSELARVTSTRVGSAERLRPTNPPSPERRLYAIDFEGLNLPSDPKTDIQVTLSASAGRFMEPYAEHVPQTGGWRLYAEYRPPNPLPAGDVVLRARLSHNGKPITETWDAVA